MFVKSPKKMIGSPRAFIRYNYHENEVPHPKPFIEGKKVLFSFC